MAKSKFSLSFLKEKKWIFFLLLMLFFCLFAKTILQKGSFAFDQTIFDFLEKIRSNQATAIFKIITNLVSLPALIVFCLLIYFNSFTRKHGNLVVINLGIVTIFNYLLKLFFARERPFGIALIEETGYSFPSGHSMISMAYFGFLIYLIYHGSLSTTKKTILMILCSIIIFAIGLSRIYLGVHYPSDVMGGFFLSVAYLIVFTHLIDIYRKNRSVEV